MTTKNKNFDTIKDFQKRVITFGEDRDWTKFHSPKNLAMALSVEASELVEIFQWMSEEQSTQLSDEQKQRAGHELADIFMYTLIACNALGIDLERVTNEKIGINENRFKKT